MGFLIQYDTIDRSKGKRFTTFREMSRLSEDSKMRRHTLESNENLEEEVIDLLI